MRLSTSYDARLWLLYMFTRVGSGARATGYGRFHAMTRCLFSQHVCCRWRAQAGVAAEVWRMAMDGLAKILYVCMYV